MDLRRLEVFCKVVELKSFTKAAEALSLSQPTISECIRSLEEMIGKKLVDRLGREVLPNPAGQVLYPYAVKIIELRQEAVQAIDEHSGKVSGQLLLGAGTIPGTYILPEFIGAFKGNYPLVRINLRISGSRRIAEDLLRGDLEAGVIGAKWNDPSLEWEEMFLDELVLTVYPQHRWAERDEISLPELEQEPFILREQYSGTRKVMNEILADHGFNLARLSVVAEMGSTEAVRQSIKARIGVSILSRQAVADDIESGSLLVVPIKEVQFYRPFYLVTRKNRQISPVCSIFLDELRSKNQILFHRLV